MRPADRAVLFDLDDTLYRERRFAFSGLRAVARATAADSENEARILRLMSAALRRGERHRVFQRVCEVEGWPPTRVPDMVSLYRRHQPRLTLPAASREVLRQLRPSWALAVVTNGDPEVQARKVAALGVSAQVDAVIFAERHARGGKPAHEPFAAAAAALGVAAGRCVFVGNDPYCDVQGARRAGMHSIHLRRGGGEAEDQAAGAEATAERIEDVPALASALLDGQDALCA